MNCRSCNRTLPARARYCVHCGAEQDLPTPIAFAAAMAGVRREAANAVYAEAAPPPRGEARGPDTHAGFPPRVDTHAAPDERVPNREDTASDELDSTPAYSNAPSRYRLATTLIVACLVVGAAGLTAAWWLRPAPPLVAAPSTADTAMPAPATPASPPAEPANTSPPAADNATPSAPPAAADTSTAPTAEAPSSTEAAPPAEPSAEAPVEITPLPPHRSASRSHAAPHAPAAKPEASAAETAPAPAPVQAPPAKQRAAAAPPPAAAAPVDRWARMNEEMSRCTREDFIARVVCGQRVRFRYCDGYWGKVPACPGNPAPERGQ